MPYTDDGVGYQKDAASENAARHVKAGTLRAKVLEGLREHGPIGADDLADKLGMHPRSTQPRLTELQDLGLATKTGEMVEGHFGRPVNVWRAGYDGDHLV